MSESAIRVFVVDDDPSFLTSIDRWLCANGYAVETYRSAADFLAQRPIQVTGCVVADLKMPGMNGMQLQKALAQTDNPLPVVFLSGQGDIPSSVQAMRDGAEDFLTKTAPKEELLDAIERALARDARERKDRARKCKLLMRFEQLTPRENEVLAYVLHGWLNKQIAAELDIDERSVKRHRTNFMHKLDVSSVAELAQIAVEAGISGEIRAPSDALN